MSNDKQHASPLFIPRGVATVVVSLALSGCAMHRGENAMDMSAMRESPMHQMMEDMGCEHSPSDMEAMKKRTAAEKHAHMKAHMQECKAKMRRQATDEALAKLDDCLEHRMGGRHAKRMNRAKMHEMMIANLRACVSQEKSAPVQPDKPKGHEGHH